MSGTTKPQIYIMVGMQGSGKSTKAREIAAIIPNSVIHSRDERGGALIDLLAPIEADLKAGKTPIIDNTHLTRDIRTPFIHLGKRHGADIHCIYMQASMEDCQVRLLHRMYKSAGEVYMTGKAHLKHPHIFPPAVLFTARKSLQEPKADEGLSSITKIKVPPFKWEHDRHFLVPEAVPTKGLFLDIDGTLRETEHLQYKYPTTESEVQLIHDPAKMRAVLEGYRGQGYRLIGISNQSGIAKKILSQETAEKVMERTRVLLGYTEAEFPIYYCPHQAAPVTCYCRKPQSGLGVQAIEKYKLDPAASLMVGDQKTDETFATRLGIPFISAQQFWANAGM
jgi:histidinol-phosphate phosphatase family protein